MRHAALRRPARAALAAVTIALAGCAAGVSQPQPVDTGARALVYGHIAAPKPIERVELAKMLSPRRPSAHVLPTGDFYFEDVAPGDYGLLRFMAGGEWYLLMTGDRENNKRFVFTATAGGTHYVGAWRVTGQQGHTFKPDEFTIERSSTSAGTVLARLRPALVGTGWEAKVPGARGAKPAPAKAKAGG